MCAAASRTDGHGSGAWEAAGNRPNGLLPSQQMNVVIFNDIEDEPGGGEGASSVALTRLCTRT